MEPTLAVGSVTLEEEKRDEAIPRSKSKLTRGTLERLLSLHQKQPWLERRQTQLFDLLELCDNVDEQDLLCDLLYRFTYLDAGIISESLDQIVVKIHDEWKYDPATTVICAINKSSYSDSSEAILWMLKPKFAKHHDWSLTNFHSSLQSAVDAATSGSVVVLVDEFVGSGTTMSKAASWISQQLDNKGVQAKIRLCSIAAMKAAENRISEAGFDLFSTMWLKRGISDHFIDPELSPARTMMERLESLLAPKSNNRKLSDHRFGYKKSESLYYWSDGNPPNNIFPIFWWKTLKGEKRRAPLLERLG